MSNPEHDPSNPSDAEQAVEDALKKAAENASGDSAELDAAGDESAPGDNTLEQALADAERYKDMALRAEAEMQNVRRRAEQDVEKAHKFGLEKLVGGLLPVVDSLEKAIESAEAAGGSDEGATQAILEGVGLCHKMFLDVLAKEGCEQVDPEGEPFDPNLHQAMSAVENGDVEPNTVLTVVQKGYSLNGRLVRPAMVMVSKAPAQ